MTQLAKVEPTKEPVTPRSLVEMAVAQGADLDRLEKLMELQLRWEADQARKAFVEAMAEFKTNPPEIIKATKVSFKTSSGVTEYKHASIGDVTAAIINGLSAHGFSHRWDLDQSSGIKVTCIVTHRMGHTEKTTLTAPADTSGGKNTIQAISSTITYLERYTLLAATGLATHDMADDDGKAGGKKETVTEDQANTIHAKITENGLDMAGFLKWINGPDVGAAGIKDIPASLYNTVMRQLSAKISKKAHESK